MSDQQHLPSPSEIGETTQGTPNLSVILTPSEIAKIGSLEKTREFLGNTMENIGEERAGQLSPPHTPGRGSR